MTINGLLPRKQRMFFAYPDTPMAHFSSIVKEVNQLPITTHGTSQTITAAYTLNKKQHQLTATSKILQQGQPGAPTLIFLPWYGGKSGQTRQLLNDRSHRGWTHEGIDIFHTRKDFDQIILSARASQYAYALMLRMISERVRATRQTGRTVGLVGLSYGANLTSAYVTQKLELPDAMLVVEGGSILQTTLHTKWQGTPSDPRILAALKQTPRLIPWQEPVTGDAAARSAAVINRSDKVVLGQEDIWHDAAAKLYVRGSHLTAPILNRRKIQAFVSAHGERLLLPSVRRKNINLVNHLSK